MITELVHFKLKRELTIESLIDAYKTTAEKWAKNPDLVQKWYFYDPVTHEGGGVYIWRDREAAARWHGPEYRAIVEKLYGYPPDIRILDALIHVDVGRQSYEVLTEIGK